MQYTSEFILPFEPSGYIPVVRVKQGDTSTRFLRITVVDKTEKYIPGAELTIMFREEKPDGHHVMTDNAVADEELGRTLVVLNEDGTITVELIEQMTACPGYCKCDICFASGDQILSTASFILEVIPGPNVGENIVSSDDFRSLVNALNNVWRAGVVTVPGTVAAGYINVGTTWSGNNPYTAAATAQGYTVTSHTIVNILNDADTLIQLAKDGVTSLYCSNDNGSLTAVAIGGKPSKALRIPVSFTETGTATYDNVQDGQVIAYDAATGEWVNRDPGTYGYLTEATGKTLIESYGYLTGVEIERKVTQMIEEYFNALDGSNIRY